VLDGVDAIMVQLAFAVDFLKLNSFGWPGGLCGRVATLGGLYSSNDYHS
jgi:hypothetical protein